MNMQSRTVMKEKEGEKLIKKYGIFDLFFSENTGYRKIVTKKKQLAGVDYEIYGSNSEVISIDIKVCMGSDYLMHIDDYNNADEYRGVPGIVVEIYQNDIFTNHNGKLTDYVLYVQIDQYGTRFYLYSYEDIQKIALAHRYKYIVDEKINMYRRIADGKYKMHKSFNGTGDYIKVEYDNLKLYGIKEIASV